MGGHPGSRFWDTGSGSEPAVFIWQDGNSKVSIWLELVDVHPTANNPHPLDDLLLQMAESMRR